MDKSLVKIQDLSGSVKTWDESEVLMSRMKHIESELDSINICTETEFMTIGGMFSDFHRRARGISEVSARVAAQMSGLEIVSAIDALNGLMEKMENYLNRAETETRKRTDQLQEILEMIDLMHGPLEDFKALARTLRSIIVTASTQNAFLITKNDELKVLLDGVKELSGIIAVMVENVTDVVRSVRNTLDESLSKLLLFEGKQQAEARAILGRTMSVLCAITEKYGFSTALARNIADRSREISLRTGEIVTSVQFHDITRQQFEGVKKALVSLSESSPAFPGGQTRFQENNNLPSNAVSEVMDFCRQQAIQLLHIRDTFVAAVNVITGNLRHISDNIASISSETQKITGHGVSDGKTFLAEMEGMLSSVTVSFTALSENARAGRELSSTILSITDSTTEMSKFIADIEEITDDMQSIAFNAEIKASQIGREGASFEVVAVRIERLSAESCGHTKTISERLGEITSLSDELSTGIALQLESAGAEIEGISGEIESLINTLSSVNRNISYCFTDIDEAGSSLSADIDSFTEGINIHTMVETIVNRVAAGLNNIAAYAGLQLPGRRKDETEWFGETINVSPVYPGGAENILPDIHTPAKKGFPDIPHPDINADNPEGGVEFF